MPGTIAPMEAIEYPKFSIAAMGPKAPGHIYLLPGVAKDCV
jgi:hypothetical protein